MEESGLVKVRVNIAVINGPLMNLLGIREPAVYGNMRLSDINNRLKALALQKDVDITFFQADYEGDIVTYLIEHQAEIDGIMLNPAALTKTGYSILEVLSFLQKPFIEVHMSNIYSRGGWHADSIFSPNAIGQVVGFKAYSYDLALLAVCDYLRNEGHS